MQAGDYANGFGRKIDDIHQEVRSPVYIASDRIKECYDIRVAKGEYVEGIWVVMQSPEETRIVPETAESLGRAVHNAEENK